MQEYRNSFLFYYDLEALRNGELGLVKSDIFLSIILLTVFSVVYISIVSSTTWILADMRTSSCHDKYEMNYLYSNLAFIYSLTVLVNAYNVFAIVVFYRPRLLLRLSLVRGAARVKYFLCLTVLLCLLSIALNRFSTKMFDLLGFFENVKFRPHTRQHELNHLEFRHPSNKKVQSSIFMI